MIRTYLIKIIFLDYTLIDCTLIWLTGKIFMCCILYRSNTSHRNCCMSNNKPFQLSNLKATVLKLFISEIGDEMLQMQMFVD